MKQPNHPASDRVLLRPTDGRSPAAARTGYHDSQGRKPSDRLKPAAVRCSGVLDGPRLISHKKYEDENVNDKHARHDEGWTEPRGAKLRRHLQVNSAAEIEK